MPQLPSSCATNSPAPRGRALGALPTVLLASLLAVGCGAQTEAPDAKPTNLAGDSSLALDANKDAVQRILDRYVQADNYSDIAKITLSYKVDGQPLEEPASIALQFHRPNRIRLEIRRGINILRLVSDGQQMWTTIEDPATENLRGQAVQVAAPERLSTTQIYSATELIDPSQPDQALSALFGMPLSLEFSQVGLLLDGLAFRHLLTNAISVQRLDDQAIDDVDCQRYQIVSPDGNYTLWWDARRAVVRRIEYPIKGLQAQMPEGSILEDIRFQADFENVRFDQPEESAFAYQPSPSATLVRFFVLPPLQLPTDKYGEIIPDFALTTLDGETESSTGWSNQLKVLTWFHDHPTSRSALPGIQQLMQRSGNEQVVFRAVFTEPVESFPNEKLRQLMTDWTVAIPVLRDLKAVGRDQFGITDAPTTVVLDREHRLHAFIVGASSQLLPTLEGVLQRLMAGENVAAGVRQRMVAEQALFEKQLAMARITVDPEQAPATELAVASEPQKLSKRELWRNDELEAPGNSIIIANDSGYRCVVLEGIQTAIELDDTGAVIGRHELPIADTAGVSKLRTAIDRQGSRYYLGFVQFGEQLHVFDESFARLTTYPADAQPGARILDAQLLDLDGDGELEIYVGFADPVGLHRVSLQGQREWGNRASPSVVSMAPRWLAKPPYLLTTSDDGTLRPTSPSGRGGPSIAVKNRLIHQLVASQSRQPRKTQFVGMAFTLEGRLIAVGLDPQLKEAWSYGLPGGTYTSQVETPFSAQLFSGEARQWVFAGPDGSIHVVNDDGSFFDFFNTGYQITGISAIGSSGVGRLVVSTPGHVTAYELRAR